MFSFLCPLWLRSLGTNLITNFRSLQNFGSSSKEGTPARSIRSAGRADPIDQELKCLAEENARLKKEATIREGTVVAHFK